MFGLLSVLTVFLLLLWWKGYLWNFLSLQNLQVLFHQNSIPAVVALGMLLVIISGGIDLSVGSVVALVTVVSMSVFRLLEARGVSPLGCSVGAIVLGVGVGGLCGVVNGVVITGLRVSPFVATLGMMSIARGLAVGLAERRVISFRGEAPAWVVSFSEASAPPYLLFGPSVWSVAFLAILVAVALHYTVLGRYCYAIGSNEATARLCGINVSRSKILLYGMAGLLTGWAGVLQFAYSRSGDPNVRQGLELQVIAAVVIGGASLSGGQGTVLGTILGILILAVMENSIGMLGAPIEITLILIGLIVILNTGISQWQRRRSE